MVGGEVDMFRATMSNSAKGPVATALGGTAYLRVQQP